MMKSRLSLGDLGIRIRDSIGIDKAHPVDIVFISLFEDIVAINKKAVIDRFVQMINGFIYSWC